MIKDVLYSSKVLDGLFTENDFSFLNEADNEIIELNEVLRNQKVSREHIINFINYFENSKTSFASDIFKEATLVFELVNTNIKNIYSLQEQFQQLEKSIVEFIVDLENGNSLATNAITDIKSKINSYSNSYKDIRNELLLNNSKIDNFLEKISIASNTQATVETLVGNDATLNSPELNLTLDIEDNTNLIISENQKKVFLPYTKEEILEFIKKYPNEYQDSKDVIEQEFIIPISTYSKHPTLARFREAYSLIRDREMKSIMDAFKYAIDLMFKYELHPAIIAACKSEKQLDDYLQCLSSNTLDNFKHFKIEFEVSPFAVKNDNFSV